MAAHSKIPLIVIVGATATGKSELAVALAKKISGAIVNADSRQVYTEMPIGTGMPIFETFENGTGFIETIPHYGYRVHNPDETTNVVAYKKRTDNIIAGIFSQNKIPLLVGGTGLYVQAIIDDVHYPATTKNIALREALNSLSLLELQKRAQHDVPEKYVNMDVHNPRRLIRAIEIKLSGAGDAVHHGLECPLLMCGVRMARETVYARIDKRVEEMMSRGLENEVSAIISKYGKQATAMSGIGYKEFLPYFAGHSSYAQAVATIKQHTRNYAKRQETWFKRDSRINWYDPTVQSLDKIIADLEDKIATLK